MAKVKRSSTDNIFGNKGTVRPRQKTGADESSQEVMSISDKFDEVPEEPVEEDISAEVQNKEETITQSVSTPKNDNKPSEKNNLDKIFKDKKGYGVTKSVYFQKEILDYCNSISKKYGVTFSEVVNKLIETYMSEEE
jgi:hypothetical protein